MSTETMTVVMLLAAMLQPDPKNPRRKANGDEGLRELALDIKRRGVLLPLLVRRDGEVCIIIDGHRRHAAALLAGLEKVPCLVFGKEATEAEVREAQLVTQLHSQALTPFEIYTGAKNWLALHAGANGKQLAEAISRSEGYVSMVLSLDRCIAQAKALAAAGELGLKEWYALSKLSPEKQVEKLKGHQPEGEHETIKVKRIKCEVPGRKAKLVISGKDMSLAQAIDIVQEWLREAKKAAEQGLSATSFERVCRDKSKAG